MNPLSILTFFKSELFKYITMALVAIGIIYFIFHAGEMRIQAKWDAATLRAETEKVELKGKTDDVTVKTVIKYVDKIRTVEVKGDTIIQYVDTYITPKSDAGCTIPKNAIVLLDAAATNTLPPTKEVIK